MALPPARDADARSSRRRSSAHHFPGSRMHARRIRINHFALLQVSVKVGGHEVSEKRRDDFNSRFRIARDFRTVFSIPKSIQATVTLLENLHVILEKTPRDDIRSEVLPMLYNAFESATIQVQVSRTNKRILR